MPKLYIKEYRKALVGKTLLIACREGILRDHFSHIIEDIRFLDRQGVDTIFLHNLSNRFANQKHFSRLAFKLFNTRVVRIPNDRDFYECVLNYPARVSKIIFLERKYLIGPNGLRINSLSTQKARQGNFTYGDLIGNLNFKRIIEQVCQKIESNEIERVHILPAGKHTIKHELFTIEGTGTLIANNFVETFEPLRTDEDLQMVSHILTICHKEGYLKQRSKQYVETRRQNFFTAKIDGIIVGCTEKLPIDEDTVELGALAISTKFRNQQIGLLLIHSFIEEMEKQGYKTIISLTNNPKLKDLYLSLGFEEKSPAAYRHRQEQSPGVTMYHLSL